MKTIAICNQKGGVAKTTTTVNIGVGLAQKGYRVLLVDLDPQYSLTDIFRVDSTNNIATLMAAQMENGSIDSFSPARVHGLDVMPASSKLNMIERLLVTVEFGREMILSKILDTVHDNYDYILIDCAASLSLLTINALAAANSVLIPLKAKHMDFIVLPDLLSTIQKMRDNMRLEIAVEGVVLTMYATNRNLDKEIDSTVHELEVPVFAAKISEATKVAEASRAGESVLTYAPNCKAALEYRALVDELEARG